MNIPVTTIKKIIHKTNGDVCQVGVELANKYSTTDSDYDDIWTGAQDMFDNNYEGKPYTLKKSKESIYAKKLHLYYLKNRHRGTSIQDR